MGFPSWLFQVFGSSSAGVGWSDFYFNDDHGSRHLDTVGKLCLA